MSSSSFSHSTLEVLLTPLAYNKTMKFRQDLMASIVVFLVALPLCMGIAIASGMPPAAGLVTGIVGGVLVGLVQGSPLQVSGPAAGLAVIVWELLSRHGATTLAAIIFLSGLFQVVAALLKGGRWFRAVPPSVVNGMMAGIGVLIVASQFHVMVDDRPKSNGLENLLSIPAAVWKGVASSPDLPHQEAALVGLLTLSVLVCWAYVPGRLRRVPAPLAAVTLASVVAGGLSLPIAYVQVPDSLLSALQIPSLAELTRALMQPMVWGAALAMACVASAETLLSASAVDAMHQGPRTHYNRELLGQGLGNALCGLLGALPMTGVIVRSSVNVQAGARSRQSTVLHGLWLLALVVLAPGVLRLVPVSALAAILVYTGLKLANPSTARRLAVYGRTEVAVYFLTMGAIVATDLLKGVLLGLAVACFSLLYRLSRMEIRVDDDPQQGRCVIHVEGAATFLRLPDIAEALEQVPRGREVHVSLERVEHLDHAALELLQTYDRLFRQQGGDLVVDWERIAPGLTHLEAPAGAH